MHTHTLFVFVCFLFSFHRSSSLFLSAKQTHALSMTTKEKNGVHVYMCRQLVVFLSFLLPSSSLFSLFLLLFNLLHSCHLAHNIHREKEEKKKKISFSLEIGYMISFFSSFRSLLKYTIERKGGREKTPSLLYHLDDQV